MESKKEKIIAIDASTNSLAFAIFESGQIGMVGKIHFAGSDVYQKCIDASKKVQAFLNRPEFAKSSIVIEHTVFLNSPKTAADLAMVQGAIIGTAGTLGISEIGRVSPITWQNFIGNKKLTKDELAMIKTEYPGKTDAWYKAYARVVRKKRTMKFVNTTYNKNIDDDDVADACGIGHWAMYNWNKATGLDKEG